MATVQGISSNFMEQVISRFQQTQSKVLLDLMAAGKSAIVAQTKPLGRIAPDTASKVDVYA